METWNLLKLEKLVIAISWLLEQVPFGLFYLVVGDSTPAIRGLWYWTKIQLSMLRLFHEQMDQVTYM